MNKVFLIGNVTRTPDGGSTKNGNTYVSFNIAVNTPYLKDGERQTSFFNIKAWNTLAENCLKYLDKGSKVSVVGSLQNKAYEDKDGVKRFVTEIIASEVEFLSQRQGQDVKQVEEIDESQLPF